MKSIEVKVLNPSVIKDSRDMLVAMARLTQRAEKISSMADLETLLSKAYSASTVQTMVDLPHPTIQKFGVINIAIVGASRRFLAQITRHQNEVKFMSGSLQYSDYSDDAQFVIPYEIIEADSKVNTSMRRGIPEEHRGPNDMNFFPAQITYLKSCKASMTVYKDLAARVGNDAAGYAAPQGLRNVLIISATPYQFKHMIAQRSCNRNTKETQFVMLKVWEALFEIDPILFSDCGPYCGQISTCGRCPEGKMCCGKAPICTEPTALLNELFPLIRRR